MNRNGLPRHTDVAARDVAVADQPRRDELGRVDADGEADALRAHDHGGVDADHLGA